MNDWLLRVRNLTKIYGEPDGGTIDRTGPRASTNICSQTGAIVACADISFDLYPGEVLGVVGESGSGKSTLVQLLYFDQEATAGEVLLQAVEEGNANLLTLSGQRKRYLRNHLLGMVYQNPRDGLNLNFSAGGNIAEKLIMAGQMHVGKMRERSLHLLAPTASRSRHLDDCRLARPRRHPHAHGSDHRFETWAHCGNRPNRPNLAGSATPLHATLGELTALKGFGT